MYVCYVEVVGDGSFSHAPRSMNGVRSEVATGYRCPFYSL